MFAQAEKVQANRISEHRVVDEVSDYLRVRYRSTLAVASNSTKSVQTKFDVFHDRHNMPRRQKIPPPGSGRCYPVTRAAAPASIGSTVPEIWAAASAV